MACVRPCGLLQYNLTSYDLMCLSARHYRPCPPCYVIGTPTRVSCCRPLGFVLVFYPSLAIFGKSRCATVIILLLHYVLELRCGSLAPLLAMYLVGLMDTWYHCFMLSVHFLRVSLLHAIVIHRCSACAVNDIGLWFRRMEFPATCFASTCLRAFMLFMLCHCYTSGCVLINTPKPEHRTCNPVVMP